MPDVPLLTGVQAMGWMIEMFPVVTVLLVSGWFLTQRQGKDDGGVFDGLFSPTKEWGPRYEGLVDQYHPNLTLDGQYCQGGSTAGCHWSSEHGLLLEGAGSRTGLT